MISNTSAILVLIDQLVHDDGAAVYGLVVSLCLAQG